jgi:hypothetical protein
MKEHPIPAVAVAALAIPTLAAPADAAKVIV